MTAMKCLALLCVIVVAVNADVYMHNPRGSNNRLDEQNRNRNNANRMFDSQNNNKGGYNVNAMDYYAGSLLPVEWTNQHSCANQNNHCEVVMQYMCDADENGAGIRNGQIRNTIDPATPDDPQYGRHETYETYKRCVVRERNMGLFLADQNLNANENTAQYTRQNTNADRYGLECSEERDYYPYWHPSDWMDIVVMTSDFTAERCDYYQAESQNVKAKNFCNGTKDDPDNAGQVIAGDMHNNELACTTNGFNWVEQAPWSTNPLAPITGVAAPECIEAPWSRDNHLGNGLNGYANQYQWELPQVTTPVTCVLRLRYNISTGDYGEGLNGWNIDAAMNGDNTPFQDNEDMDFGQGVNLRLNINTDQYGRTFQDRSSTFTIKPRPAGIGNEATIYNLNVKGQRGNIVQNYPAVEYDYMPSQLSITTADYVHRQVTGSNTTPAGAGQGQESTDRHNFVQIDQAAVNYPSDLADVTQIGDIDPLSEEGFLMVKRWALLDQNDNEIDDASPHQDFGLVRYSQTGSIHYMNTRNNNFTNRSQKGSLLITDGEGIGFSTIVIISVAVAAGVLLPAALVAYGVARPSSSIGKVIRKPFGGSSSSGLPAGYTDGYMGA